MKRRTWAPRQVLAVVGWICILPCGLAFDYKQDLFGGSSRISANVVTQNVITGYVQFNGGAVGLASAPVWRFGDGACITNWFPAAHTYANLASNYIVTVTGYFTDGATNETQMLVRFAPASFNYVALPSKTAVRIPSTNITLVSRMGGYGFSPTLTNFNDSFFSSMLPRTNVEYVLSVAASIQMDYVSSNVFLIDNAFQQHLLRDPSAGGMYSIWYSGPVAFGAADYAFQGTPQYSSFFHEMAHNFTLNFPTAYYYGGKIDGNANAIYSETMAQIFQHSTAYDLLNAATHYGIPADVAFEVAQNARSSMKWVRNSYESYLSSGTGFHSWNDPATPAIDEALNTFMTIAYKFCQHAEDANQGYREPTKRFLFLLESFDSDLRQRYDQNNNTVAADEFRATLMVTAMSYAFQTNLMAEFRSLRFPVSDSIYNELMRRVRADTDGDSLPDGWEYTYFNGLTNAIAESDGDDDGMSNRNEYLAGTDPTNNASVFAVVDLSVGANGSPVISWSSVSNRSYSVGATDDICNDFSPIETNILGTPPLNTYTGAVTADQSYFMRIKLE